MKTAMKHINAIFAGVMVVAFFLPFVSISMGGFGSVSFSYFKLLTEGKGDGMLWMFLILLGVIALGINAYVAAIAKYSKYINIAAPVVIVLSAFMAMDGGLSYAGFGFWLIVIAAVLAAVVAVIKLLGLKGNPVFDAVNDDAE